MPYDRIMNRQRIYLLIIVSAFVLLTIHVWIEYQAGDTFTLGEIFTFLGAFALIFVSSFLVVIPMQRERAAHIAKLTAARDKLTHELDERTRAQAQAKELVQEREKVRLLSEMSAATSHDLRTPLSTINMNLYFLVQQDDIEVRRERAARIEREIEHLTAIIDQMQLMSQLENNILMKSVAFDINDLVRTTEGRLRKWSERKHQSITIQFDAQRLMVQGDPVLMTRALTNLIENAILYTPDHGTIRIGSHYSSDQHRAEISVRDTGVGIAQPDLPHVFDPFYKVNKARTPDDSRNGLGLAITRRIVELHDGSIHVESEPERGSVFTISLPIVNVEYA